LVDFCGAAFIAAAFFAAAFFGAAFFFVAFFSTAGSSPNYIYYYHCITQKSARESKSEKRGKMKDNWKREKRRVTYVFCLCVSIHKTIRKRIVAKGVRCAGEIVAATSNVNQRCKKYRIWHFCGLTKHDVILRLLFLAC
jgi:hypothetical protein